ncbi:unnamed protein product [Caenorhabditis auriculariae]|uniref:Uncharacterized protein n=1 Tax=Caenorhabditis auriculariae TaxID=2777116 RepID=A0A8S1H5P9_9PELO|nr:unnamed protein product [Caenorhabditis auriculariae]
MKKMLMDVIFVLLVGFLIPSCASNNKKTAEKESSSLSESASVTKSVKHRKKKASKATSRSPLNQDGYKSQNVVPPNKAADPFAVADVVQNANGSFPPAPKAPEKGGMVGTYDPNYQTLAGLNPDCFQEKKPEVGGGLPQVKAPEKHQMVGTYDPNYQTLAALNNDVFNKKNEPAVAVVNKNQFLTY